MKGLKTTEIWRQDAQVLELWHGDDGLIVNTPALAEREAYFEVIRIPAYPKSELHSPRHSFKA